MSQTPFKTDKKESFKLAIKRRILNFFQLIGVLVDAFVFYRTIGKKYM